MTKAQRVAAHLFRNDLQLPLDLIASLNEEGCIIHEFENSILEGETNGNEDDHNPKRDSYVAFPQRSR